MNVECTCKQSLIFLQEGLDLTQKEAAKVLERAGWRLVGGNWKCPICTGLLHDETLKRFLRK